jgi:hypothetical protein
MKNLRGASNIKLNRSKFMKQDMLTSTLLILIHALIHFDNNNNNMKNIKIYSKKTKEMSSKKQSTRKSSHRVNKSI